MKKLSIRDLDLEGKRVFIRVDFNVQLNKDGGIQNDTRIKLSLPTIPEPRKLFSFSMKFIKENNDKKIIIK